MSRGGPGTGNRERRSGRRSWLRPVLAAALAVQLLVGLLAVGADPVPAAQTTAAAATTGTDDARAATGPWVPGAPADPTAAASPAAAPLPDASAEPGPPAEPAGAPAGAPAPAADGPSGEGDVPLVVPDPGAASAVQAASSTAAPTTRFAASAPAGSSEEVFAREHPTHAAARQRDDVPSSFHWAVIVGVNDYMGRTTSTIGSVGDAHSLRDTLYAHGWRGDQVLTLTDHAATHDRVVRAIEWLIRSTDERSTVVFSFSGHMRHEGGVTALWPADNRFLWASDLGRMLGAVRADRMWVSLQGCHAAGLAAPGLEGANRVVTYASRVEDKAYEDPATGHSVMGHYLFAEALRDGRSNSDGRLTVQDAFAWAAPRATSRTTGQRYGAQHPVMADGFDGRRFPIAVTGPPAPAAAPAPAPSGGPDRAPSRGLLDVLNRLPL